MKETLKKIVVYTMEVQIVIGGAMIISPATGCEVSTC